MGLGAFSFEQCEEELASCTLLLLTPFQVDQYESLWRYQLQHHGLCAMIWAKGQPFYMYLLGMTIVFTTRSFNQSSPIEIDIPTSREIAPIAWSSSPSPDDLSDDNHARLMVRPRTTTHKVLYDLFVTYYDLKSQVKSSEHGHRSCSK